MTERQNIVVACNLKIALTITDLLLTIILHCQKCTVSLIITDAKMYSFHMSMSSWFSTFRTKDDTQAVWFVIMQPGWKLLRLNQLSWLIKPCQEGLVYLYLPAILCYLICGFIFLIFLDISFLDLLDLLFLFLHIGQTYVFAWMIFWISDVYWVLCWRCTGQHHVWTWKTINWTSD